MKKDNANHVFYYHHCGLILGDFIKVDKNDFKTINELEYDGACGPFETFKEAKTDAIARYVCDKNDATQSLKDARKTKLKDVIDSTGVKSEKTNR